jgi:hypothetical protein
MNRLLGFAGALLIGLSLAGCGGKGIKTGTVYGKVTLDGQPLAEGTISFTAVDGSTPTAGGKITDGNYNVAAVPRGTHKVLISSPRVKSSRKLYAEDPNSPVVNEYEETLPTQYTNPFETPLSVEVNASSVNQDFNLSSTP